MGGVCPITRWEKERWSEGAAGAQGRGAALGCALTSRSHPRQGCRLAFPKHHCEKHAGGDAHEDGQELKMCILPVASEEMAL